MIQPCRDYLLVSVARAEKEHKTTAGIIIQAPIKKDPFGTIEAVGEGRYCEDGTLIPCNFEVGTKILFKEYTAIPVGATQDMANDRDYLLIPQNSVVAKII